MSEPTERAMALAEKLWSKMVGLKGGPWAVHPSEFLPAEVCCDHVGRMRFLKMLAEIIDENTRPASPALDRLKEEIDRLREWNEAYELANSKLSADLAEAKEKLAKWEENPHSVWKDRSNEYKAELARANAALARIKEEIENAPHGNGPDGLMCPSRLRPRAFGPCDCFKSRALRIIEELKHE